MNNYKNYVILLLSGLLIFSVTSQPAESASKYATSAELKNVVLALVQEIANKDKQINQLWDCVNNLSVDPGGSGREVTCP